MGAKRSKRGKEQGKPAHRRRKRNPKRYTLHFVILAVFCIAAGITLSLTVFFNIEEIEIIGNSRYSNEEVIATTGIIIGDNLFRTDSEAVILLLRQKYYYFDEIMLRKMYPAKLSIDVTMEEPAVAIETAQGYALLAEDGKILEAGVAQCPEGLLKVKGLESHEYIPGAHLTDAQLESYIMLKGFMDAATVTQLDKIGYIDLSDRYNIRALYDNRIMIEFGNEAKLEYKMNFVKQILATEISDSFEGLMDVSIDKRLRTRPMDIEVLIEQAANTEPQPVAPVAPPVLDSQKTQDSQATQLKPAENVPAAPPKAQPEQASEPAALLTEDEIADGWIILD